MPVTFPAHQGLILPVIRRWPNSFDALALSVGAAMPDITDTVLGFLMNGYFKQWYGHSLLGIFSLDLVGGLFLTWLIAGLDRRLSKAIKLPQRLRIFFMKGPPDRDPVVASNTAPRSKARLSLWSVSVFVGILSHVGFDLISHDTNLLIYPWYEDVRWFPGWWYTKWFKIRPLPMFGQSYSVGVFSVIWCILTLLGTFLFVRFLSPNYKNRI